MSQEGAPPPQSASASQVWTHSSRCGSQASPGSAQFASVGYWIDKDYAGRGVMPRAVAMVIDHCFFTAGLHRIEIAIRPENSNSLRVVEKLEIREIGYAPKYLHIDGAWRDHVGYALTIEDVMPEGGLMARWQRLRGRGHVSPDRA